MNEKLLNQLKFYSGSKLPMIHQAENSECGLCCLLMVAFYHGYKSSLVEERKRFELPKDGTNLFTLCQLANEMNLIGRGIKVSVDKIKLIKTPCILHWEMKHFVVLKEVKSNVIVIHDPALGVREITLSDFSKSFTGVALEITPSHDFKKVDNAVHLKFNQLWTKISGLKKHLSFIIILSFFIQVLVVVSPFYLQEIIDSVVVNDNHSLLTMLALCFSLLMIARVATEYTQSVLLLHLTTKLNLQLATNVFRHLIRLPLPYFMNRHIGDVISRFRAIDEIRKAMSVSIINVIIESIMSLVTLIMMTFYSVKLTCLVIAVIVLYLLLRYFSYSKLETLTHKSIINHAIEHSHFMETLRSIQSIKIHNKINTREFQWVNKYISALNIDIQLDKWQINFTIINRVIFLLGNILIIYMAANLILDNYMSVGMLYAFISYKDHFITKMSSLIDQFVDLKMIRLYLDRLGDIIINDKDKEQKLTLNNNLIFRNKIIVNNISFRHNKYSNYVFNNVSFTIDAGESVAIVGPSGCGKTTIIKCLMGLLIPESGFISIDGTNLQDIEGYHQHISAVMQDDALLSGTIMDNITFFDDNPDFDLAVECSKIACIYDDIINFPSKFYTIIGDMGSSFSGGQQQRIILARALYMQPEIIFMDEATSSLDKLLETTINENISKLNITRIIVAHRSDTIKSADRTIDLSRLIDHKEVA